MCESMCACMHACVCVCMCVCVLVHMSACVHVCRCACTRCVCIQTVFTLMQLHVLHEDTCMNAHIHSH